MDTHGTRQAKYDLIAEQFDSACVMERLWKTKKIPDGGGTTLEGLLQPWLKQVILAGGLQSNGWARNTPEEWKTKCGGETDAAWLSVQCNKAKKWINSKAWKDFEALEDNRKVVLHIITSKTGAVVIPAKAMAAPPKPPSIPVDNDTLIKK